MALHASFKPSPAWPPNHNPEIAAAAAAGGPVVVQVILGHCRINSWISHRSHKRLPFGISKRSPVCIDEKRRWDFRRVRASRGSDAVVDAIFELEYMVREPADVLEGMRERLSTRDLQLVLLYFSQDGRDSWCALEVFEWMQQVNMVEDETRDLMMSIMFKWLMKLVEQGRSVEDVKGLMRDMSCVGLQPESSIVHAIVSAYWDGGKKEEALKLVKDISASQDIVGEGADNALAFLILKMADSNDQREAMKLVAHFRECGFKLELNVYNAALLAALSEQQQLTRMMRQLVAYQKKGKVGELEDTEKSAIQAYERGLHEEAEQIAGWAVEQEAAESMASVHEKLLAMYCVAGRGLDAERQLWQMKLAGRKITIEMYNNVVGICAYGNHGHAARRIMETMKAVGVTPNKKTYSVLFRGFVKGGNVEEAVHAFLEMLDKGFIPDQDEVLVVMREMQKTGNITLVIELGQRIAQAGLIEPFFVYLYIDRLKLCILFML